MIPDKLRDIFAEVLRVDRNELTEQTTIKEDLGADSLDLYQILLLTEERFNVRVSAHDFYRADTVGDICSLISGGMHEQP